MLPLILALQAAATAASPSPAPDYTQDAAWLCRPGRADACSVNQDVTVIQANGTTKIEKFKPAAAPQFDCFYVYPTVSLDPTPNSDMTAGPEEKAVAALQAARFTSKCRVYAPIYRQVTLAALQRMIAGGAFDGDRAMVMADISAAWADYVNRSNGGRGVVLIGHSQGALALTGLLQQIENSDMRRNVISAMIIGANVEVPVGQSVGGTFKKFPICTSGESYACVVTYQTFRADSPPPAGSRFSYPATPGMQVACTNPAALGSSAKVVTDAILHTTGSGVAAAKPGPWVANGAAITTDYVKVPGLISAQCASSNGANYLAVTVNANPADPRTDTIVGDITMGGVTLKDWGLHLIDMPVEMGDLVNLAERQAYLWRGITPPKNGRPRQILD